MMKKIMFFVAAMLPVVFASCEKQEPHEDFEFAAVDIGLSVKWANANLGATSPEDYGDYYAWGETETKADYSWKKYKWCKGSLTSLSKYNTNPEFGTVDNNVELDPEDDVARVKLGGSWRMPTVEEIDELVSTRGNPAYRWEMKVDEDDDPLGWTVTYLVNGNSIFLPEACSKYETVMISGNRFWSSSIDTDPYLAYSLNEYAQGFNADHSTNYFRLTMNERCEGLPVRAVCD
jgi:hypothetical protein